MDNFRKLDSLLKEEAPVDSAAQTDDVYLYAECMAKIENVVAVVSDLAYGTCRIFNGAFARVLGVEDYTAENSIWEKKLFELMPPTEQEAKFIAELRFFHYLRGIAKNRNHYYLMSKLRFKDANGNLMDVLHRMYYIYDQAIDRIRYAICVYGPLSVDFNGKSVIVNSLTGAYEEASSTSSQPQILSRRERQVLSLIDAGLRSVDIAARLNISKFTVSRHRQEIIAKLQVKNSIEACRLAKSMELI